MQKKLQTKEKPPHNRPIASMRAGGMKAPKFALRKNDGA